VEEVGKTVQIYFLRGAGHEIYRLLDHLKLNGEPMGYVVGE